MNGAKFEDDLSEKTESIQLSVWRIRWVIAFLCVVFSGVYLYADYLSVINGQPEIKSASFDHKINFKYLGADTGKYASNLQLDEGAMSEDGWYGQMVIRSSDPDLITRKFSLIKNSQIIDLKEIEYNPPSYYKLFNYDVEGARYQKEDFSKSNTFIMYSMFAGIALFVILIKVF